METRTSELTAKGAPIDATDLVMISEEDGGGGYVSKYVTGAEIVSDTNFANTDLTFTADRTHDLASHTVTLHNGQLGAGTLTANSTIGIRANGSYAGLQGTSTNTGVVGSGDIYGIDGSSTNGKGVRGTSTNDVGVYGEAPIGLRGLGTQQGVHGYTDTAGGIGGSFEKRSGALAVKSAGDAYIETYGLGGSHQSSALLDVNSTTQGFLLPRMTTTQRNAISSPATGLEIFNTTTGRKEYYNGTYWAGEPYTLEVGFLPAFAPADATNYYFGQFHGLTPQTIADISRVYIRKTGVIRTANILTYATTAGTNESWSFYIRLNNTTDYLIQTISATTNMRTFTSSSLNIPVVAGDYIEIKMVCPTWVTNPSGVRGNGYIIIE